MNKKTIFFILIFTMIFNISVPSVSAIENTEEKTVYYLDSPNNNEFYMDISDEIHGYNEKTKEINVLENGIEINGILYEGEKLDSIINNMQLISSDVSDNDLLYYDKRQEPTTRAAVAVPLIPTGTYVLSGIGKVVVSHGPKIVLAGVAVVKGSVLWNKIVKKIQELNKSNITKSDWNSSCEKATNKCDKNKQNHILNKKHNWNKFNKNPKWSNIAPIIIKTLKYGSEKHERSNIYLRTLVQNGKSVSVRFIKDGKELVSNISTAWVK